MVLPKRESRTRFWAVLVGFEMSTHTIHWAAAGFEAARSLGPQAVHRNQQGLHGHSFRVELQHREASGAPLGPTPAAPHHALQRRLQAVLASLDYQVLNERVPQPTDQQVLHWIVQHLDLPGAIHCKLWAGPRQGVIRDWTGRWHSWMRDRFEAAHRLPHVPPGHPCGRMHGHGFEVQLQVHGTDAAIVRELHSHWQRVRQSLHQRCLNQVAGLEIPTSEMLSRWVWQALKPFVPTLGAVTIFETASCGAVFDGQEHGIWKDHRFDSAIALETEAALPEPGDSPNQALAGGEAALESRIYGHTYVLRLGLVAPVDALLGWTVDFGDVKTLFAPVLARLDHQPLYAVLGVRSHAQLSGWVYEQACRQLSALRRITLWDTPDTGHTLEQEAPVFAVAG